MALHYNNAMHQEYSYFKPSLLNQEEQLAVFQNAVGYFRSNDQVKAKYPLLTLFQASAFFERLIVMQSKAERETPPRKISDEEFYTEDFAKKLEYFTGEYEAALVACMDVMDSVPSISRSDGSLAACFLNPLDSPHRAIPMNSSSARAEICEHALMLALTYSRVPWTERMYDALVNWYPPALLLCPEENIPPMASPAIRTALDWALSLDEKPKRRFKTIRTQFANMIAPSPQAAAHLDLPTNFTTP